MGYYFFFFCLDMNRDGVAIGKEHIQFHADRKSSKRQILMKNGYGLCLWAGYTLPKLHILF